MNTRSRITLSTVLGLSLVGLCLGSAQAQSGMKKTKAEKREMKREMRHEQMDEMNGEMEDERVPTPINYPFAAPGGVHLYHYTDFSHEAIGEGTSYMKQMDNAWHRDKMKHDRMMRAESMMTDEEKEMMKEPTPIGYPYAAPGGIHLYHYADFSQEAIGEGSSYMKKWDNSIKHEEKMHDRMKRAESMMTDEEKELMKEPTPIGYPFAAPGGVHLYHYADFSQEAVGEGSAASKKMDKAEMKEKKMKMKKDKMSN